MALEQFDDGLYAEDCKKCGQEFCFFNRDMYKVGLCPDCCAKKILRLQEKLMRYNAVDGVVELEKALENVRQYATSRHKGLKTGTPQTTYLKTRISELKRKDSRKSLNAEP